MTRKTKPIAADDMFARWRKEPEYGRAYAEAEEEFAMAAALIAARSQADFTQAELAKHLGTTQAA